MFIFRILLLLLRPLRTLRILPLLLHYGQVLHFQWLAVMISMLSYFRNLSLTPTVYLLHLPRGRQSEMWKADH